MKTFTYARFLNRLEKTTQPLLEGKGLDTSISFTFTENSDSEGISTLLNIECREMPDGSICCAPVQPDGSWKCRKQ